jgi:hypothetical protein
MYEYVHVPVEEALPPVCVVVWQDQRGQPLSAPLLVTAQ